MNYRLVGTDVERGSTSARPPIERRATYRKATNGGCSTDAAALSLLSLAAVFVIVLSACKDARTALSPCDVLLIPKHHHCVPPSNKSKTFADIMDEMGTKREHSSVVANTRAELQKRHSRDGPHAGSEHLEHHATGKHNSRVKDTSSTDSHGDVVVGEASLNDWLHPKVLQSEEEREEEHR